MKWSALAPCLLLSSAVFAQSGPTSELDTIYQRRKVDLAETATPQQISFIPTYLSTQTSNGTWPDVNYATGCAAQRANWPIQEHWNRIIALASAWSGLNPTSPSNYTNDTTLLDAALKGMDWWFENDLTESACIGQGGNSSAACPCGTPGLWNQNWFDQVILIPQLASTACLLVYSSGLTQSQQESCYTIPFRAYALRDLPFIYGLNGPLTGANTINVMQNSVSLACYEQNATILADALDRAMAVATYSYLPAEDGIHQDGSFLQHNGILYNGNYGMVLLNAFIQLEGEAIGTSFAANDTTRTAIATQVRGNEWMIYVDEETRGQRWDFNVLGRFIAFPTADNQPSGDIQFNVTKLANAVADFSGANNVSDVIARMETNGTAKFLGNHAFWASDYMVHRRNNYIIGNKMISNRSHNTEFVNSANPYGYHLGQGTLFTYVTGVEYRDIEASWDWNLIPGTTVLLNQPTLNSSYTGVTGKKTYVGVVSDGWVGTSVEDYIDPHNGGIAYRKVWFFLDDSIMVTTAAISLNTSVPGVSGAPVITVLDNRMAAPGGVWVDGAEVDASQGAAANGSTLWYGGNGYLSYGTPFALTLAEGNRTGNWSAISTSKAGNQTVDIFSAYTTIPETTYSYAFFPNASMDLLAEEQAAPTTTPLDFNGTLGAAGAERLSLVFWPGEGTSASVPLWTIGWGSGSGNFTVTTSAPAAYLFATRDNGDGTQTMVVTVADPSQALKNLSFTLAGDGMTLTCPSADYDTGCSASDGGVSFSIPMPSGGLAGSSVFNDVLVSW